ncbi:Sporulation related domain-containing protein [Malonomonas rubra DSM 5091]|uniref:Sporulation related domain-containing protein n=2 Tax=Malonomonas rubra DSM 5091 TaxID=1122189 RepID=A0A1M6CL95_MALRU|nr:SPOR domain-containing protein [Malonomonas rubra]SHI61812.1 Sporulation related domain-containing protein [Malonomonas rubra DSM 5091]
MADRDELSTENVEKTTAETPEETASNIAENGDIAGDGVGSGEIRAVQKQQRSGNAALLLGLLLLVALIGGAYFLVQSNVSSRTPQLSGDGPKRYSIDKVEEEVVDVPAVAAVEVVSVEKQPAAAKEPKKEAKPEPVAKPVVATKPATEKPQEKAVVAGPLYRVHVGPFLYVNDTKRAEEKLRKLGYQSEKIDGRGSVTMYRLLEGRYPADEARAKLPQVKMLAGDAFLLPEGGNLAIYVGSFSDQKRAEEYQKFLLKKGLNVTTVASDIEMNGKMFIVGEAVQAQARKIAAKLTDAGFKAVVVSK